MFHNAGSRESTQEIWVTFIEDSIQLKKLLKAAQLTQSGGRIYSDVYTTQSFIKRINMNKYILTNLANTHHMAIVSWWHSEAVTASSYPYSLSSPLCALFGGSSCFSHKKTRGLMLSSAQVWIHVVFCVDAHLRFKACTFADNLVQRTKTHEHLRLQEQQGDTLLTHTLVFLFSSWIIWLSVGSSKRVH